MWQQKPQCPPHPGSRQLPPFNPHVPPPSFNTSVTTQKPISLPASSKTMNSDPSSDASWEDLLDSGQLDSQINRLNINAKPFVMQAHHATMPNFPDFSVPPPAAPPTILPRPAASSTAPPAPCVVQIQGDDQHRTQYRPPEPKMKILKRPTSSPNIQAQMNGGGPGQTKPQKKTLKQREEEYAQARLRILGSAGTGTDDVNETTTSPTTGGNKQLIVKLDPSSVVRTPRGPDGSKGFHGR